MLTATAERPMNSDTHPASAMRLNTSRPSLSVPKMLRRPSSSRSNGGNRLDAKVLSVWVVKRQERHDRHQQEHASQQDERNPGGERKAAGHDSLTRGSSQA